jgi:16S rRNA C967 or C1407 C5-methylase (RsmB/RsmF family)
MDLSGKAKPPPLAISICRPMGFDRILQNAPETGQGIFHRREKGPKKHKKIVLGYCIFCGNVV